VFPGATTNQGPIRLLHASLFFELGLTLGSHTLLGRIGHLYRLTSTWARRTRRFAQEPILEKAIDQ
jgi:hypothetical protein